jgi:hypothetical protein
LAAIAVVWAASATGPSRGSAQATIRVRASSALSMDVAVDDTGAIAVRGRLLDDRGLPLAGRAVSLVAVHPGEQTHETQHALTTDTDGSFELQLPSQAGTWQLTARHAGDQSHGPSEDVRSIDVEAAPATARPPRPSVVESPNVLWLAAALLLSVLFALRGGRDRTRAMGRKARRRARAAASAAHEPPLGPRERAAAAFRPAALAILPSADLWWHRTVRETLAEPTARANEQQTEALGSLGAAVEHACYGPTLPTDREIAEIERIAGAVVDSIDSVDARR